MSEYVVSVFGVRIHVDSESELDDVEDAIDVLSDLSGVGHVAAASLVKRFGHDPTDVLDADIEELMTVDNIGEDTAQNISEGITSEEDRIERIAEKHDTFDVTYESTERGVFEMRSASGE